MHPIILLYQEKTKAPLMTEGNLSLILGASKSRKSFLVSAIATALLGRPCLGMDCKGNYNVGIFDTEQGLAFCHVAARRVHRMMTWPTDKNNERFKYFDLCGLTTNDRFTIIEGLIRSNSYDVAIIDGIVDVCYDFNNQEECTEIVNRLIKIARETKTHICSVLHFNKDDATARGHLGAFLLQKCETTMQVVKNNDYSTVQPYAKGCRHVEFEQFCFNVVDGLPHDFMATPPDTPKERTRNLFREVFASHNNETIRQVDLIKELRERFNIQERTAKKYIKVFSSEKWLTKVTSSYKNVAYRLTYFSGPEAKEQRLNLADEDGK